MFLSSDGHRRSRCLGIKRELDVALLSCRSDTVVCDFDGGSPAKWPDLVYDDGEKLETSVNKDILAPYEPSGVQVWVDDIPNYISHDQGSLPLRLVGKVPLHSVEGAL